MRAHATPLSSLCPTLVLAHHTTFFHGPSRRCALTHHAPACRFDALVRRFPMCLRSLTATRMAKSTAMSSRFVKPPLQPPSSSEFGLSISLVHLPTCILPSVLTCALHAAHTTTTRSILVHTHSHSFYIAHTYSHIACAHLAFKQQIAHNQLFHFHASNAHYQPSLLHAHFLANMA
jgi:hypothetical protein